MEESQDGRPRTFDIPGQFLFMIAVGSFAFAVIDGTRAGWLSTEILTLLVLAGAALAAFVRCERRSADPMMDLKLFGNRTYSLAIITIFAVLFATYGMLLVITQYLQNVRAFSPTDSGLVLLPYSVSVTIVSLTVGKLVGMVGSRRLILIGLASQIFGFGVLFGGLPVNMVVVVAGLVFVGMGAASCLTPITSLALTAVPPERAGMASGIISAQRALGSTVGFAVLGSIPAARVRWSTCGTRLAPSNRRRPPATGRFRNPSSQIVSTENMSEHGGRNSERFRLESFCSSVQCRVAIRDFARSRSFSPTSMTTIAATKCGGKSSCSIKSNSSTIA
ncbi:MAG: MFS transporter [Betaproteobacteria bacterium]